MYSLNSVFCGYVYLMVDRVVKISNTFKAGRRGEGGGMLLHRQIAQVHGFVIFGNSPNILFLEVMCTSILHHPKIVNR